MEATTKEKLSSVQLEIFQKVKTIIKDLLEREADIDSTLTHDLVMGIEQYLTLADMLQEKFVVEISDEEIVSCESVQNIVLLVEKKLN